MKNIFFMLLAILFCNKLFSISFFEFFNINSERYGYTYYSQDAFGWKSISFYDEIIDFYRVFDFGLGEKNCKYDIRTIEELPYMYFEKNNYLLLSNKYFIFMYGKDYPEVVFEGEVNSSPQTIFVDIDANTVSTTSFLTEGNKKYKPENIFINASDCPWVEGVKGYGIGEKLIFEVNPSRGLLISIGYVSYEKPYLYRKNSRPKTVRIYLKNSDIYQLYELNDTPNPQILIFPINEKKMYPYQERYKGTVELEIIDVYKGDNWDDTCINFVKSLLWEPNDSDREFEMN